MYDKNLYAYCDNNPVVRADSDGTLWYMAIGAALGGVISGGLEVLSQAQAGGSYDISKIIIATASGAAGGLFAATSLKIGAQIAINAGIGVGSYIADSIAHKESITFGGVVSNGLAGVASGAIGGHGANGKMLQNSWKVANKAIAKEVRRNSYKYSAKRIAQKTVVKAGIKKTTGVATARFTGGTLVSRAISNIGKSVSTWWKNLWK